MTFSRAPGAGHTSKMHPTNSGQTAFKHPREMLIAVFGYTWGANILGARGANLHIYGPGARETHICSYVGPVGSGNLRPAIILALTAILYLDPSCTYCQLSHHFAF